MNKTKHSNELDERIERATLVMVYGIFATILVLIAACIGGSAWVLWIITQVVRQ